MNFLKFDSQTGFSTPRRGKRACHDAVHCKTSVTRRPGCAVKPVLALLIFMVGGGLFGQETGRQQQIDEQRRTTPPQQTEQARQAARQQAEQTQPRRQEAQAKPDADPDKARFVIDVNPLMWIFSGIPDENNNRSMFFDAGIQFNTLSGVSLRFNPSISFGFTSETAFTASHIRFVEVELPFTFICFPFPADSYLRPAFFGISIITAFHNTLDSEVIGFVSVGALLEVGYQIKLSNHLAITPSIGISRIFPKRIEDGEYSAPNFNIYSPWTADTPVAPRARLTLGFWL